MVFLLWLGRFSALASRISARSFAALRELASQRLGALRHLEKNTVEQFVRAAWHRGDGIPCAFSLLQDLRTQLVDALQ